MEKMEKQQFILLVKGSGILKIEYENEQAACEAAEVLSEKSGEEISVAKVIKTFPEKS